MKRILILSASLLLLFTVWYYWSHPLKTSVIINNYRFYVELALTDSEKERGLGFRDSLALNQGMLFVWDHKEIFPFWMKGMRFPIDIIWIADTTIVDITHSAPVVTNGRYVTYPPQVPVNKVLEINAGLAQQYGISEGDTITIVH